MNLKELNDHELLSQTKLLVQQERKVLTRVLEHLREVERRKLYCDLKYGSLFEYCVKELKYSEGAAGRRIQAMKLLREIPEIELKIEEGRLNLSNLSQVQTYFREQRQQAPQRPITPAQKLELIEQLENKTAREGQRILLSLSPHRPLPKERHRLITEDVSEVSFLMDKELEQQLGELKSLLGNQVIGISMTELIRKMTSLSLEQLRAKKFGKKRAQRLSHEANNSEVNKNTANSNEVNSNEAIPMEANPNRANQNGPNQHGTDQHGASYSDFNLGDRRGSVGLACANGARSVATPAAEPCSRYISKAEKYIVWVRDKGRCQCCGSTHNLQFDHIMPYALSGESTADNLRLLCYQCNQRAATKVFGVAKMAQFREQI